MQKSSSGEVQPKFTTEIARPQGDVAEIAALKLKLHGVEHRLEETIALNVNFDGTLRHLVAKATSLELLEDRLLTFETDVAGFRQELITQHDHTAASIRQLFTMAGWRLP